jgi:hypothetical protein
VLNNTLFFSISKKLQENELSINALSKALQGEGFKLHKLEVRGYLRALEDFGYVEERSIPPAKIFKLKKKSESVYDVVGKQIKKIASNEKEEGELAIDALGLLFKRPVFREELRRCNIGTAHIRREGKKDEELLAALNRNGYGIPEGDICYEYTIGSKTAELLGAMVADMMNVKMISTKTKQKKLEEV